MLYTASEKETKAGAQRGKERNERGEIESAERKAAFWRIQQSAFLNQEYEGDLSEARPRMPCNLLLGRRSYDSSK